MFPLSTTIITSRQNNILKTTFLVVVFSLFCFKTIFSQDATKQNLEKERQELMKQIEDAKRELEDIKKNKKNSLAEISVIKKKMTLREKKIAIINQEIKSIEQQVKQHKADIEKIKNSISSLRSQYKKSIITAYKNSQIYNPSFFLFSSNSFSVFVDRMSFLRRFREIRTQQLTKINQTSSKLQNEIVQLSKTEQNQLSVLKEHQQEIKTLKIEEEEKKNVIRQLKQNESKVAENIQQKMKKWRKIKTTIEQLVKREIQLKNKKMLEDKKLHKKDLTKKTKNKNNDDNNDDLKSNSKVLASALTYNEKDFMLAKTFQANKGKLPWPVSKGFITMKFGRNKLTEESKITYENSGLTIQTDPNTPVRAVFNGIVSNVQDMDEGSLITIRHGQYWTIYVPLKNPQVKPNDEISAGTILGYTISGNPTELEFQILKETSFQNPEIWLK